MNSHKFPLDPIKMTRDGIVLLISCPNKSLPLFLEAKIAARWTGFVNMAGGIYPREHVHLPKQTCEFRWIYPRKR